MEKKCYVLAVDQVSNQLPLSRQWMDTPKEYDQQYTRAQEPDSKEYILPAEARRMSRILKRAICTSLSALNASGIHHPDAIISGTGMGCFENTEKFLVDISKFGESCLKPTLFMQSTHNTISSLIAIVLKCHGYNNTYSHKEISFDTALLDGWMQLLAGNFRTALIGSHDEITPFLSLVVRQSHPHYNLISEASVSAILSTSKDYSSADGKPVRPLCELKSVEILYKPTDEELHRAIGELSPDTIFMLGLNGNQENDDKYLPVLQMLTAEHTVLKYKHIFGNNFSASAIGLYAASVILDEQRIPQFMNVNSSHNNIHEADDSKEIKEITLVNHSDGSSWSVIKLRKV